MALLDFIKEHTAVEKEPQAPVTQTVEHQAAIESTQHLFQPQPRIEAWESWNDNDYTHLNERGEWVNMSGAVESVVAYTRYQPLPQDSHTRINTQMILDSFLDQHQSDFESRNMRPANEAELAAMHLNVEPHIYNRMPYAIESNTLSIYTMEWNGHRMAPSIHLFSTERDVAPAQEFFGKRDADENDAKEFAESLKAKLEGKPCEVSVHQTMVTVKVYAKDAGDSLKEIERICKKASNRQFKLTRNDDDEKVYFDFGKERYNKAAESSFEGMTMSAAGYLAAFEAQLDFKQQSDPKWRSMNAAQKINAAIEANLPDETAPYDPSEELEDMNQTLIGLDPDMDLDPDQPQPEEKLTSEMTVSDLQAAPADENEKDLEAIMARDKHLHRNTVADAEEGGFGARLERMDGRNVEHFSRDRSLANSPLGRAAASNPAHYSEEDLDRPLAKDANAVRNFSRSSNAEECGTSCGNGCGGKVTPAEEGILSKIKDAWRKKHSAKEPPKPVRDYKDSKYYEPLLALSRKIGDDYANTVVQKHPEWEDEIRTSGERHNKVYSILEPVVIRFTNIADPLWEKRGDELNYTRESGVEKWADLQFKVYKEVEKELKIESFVSKYKAEAAKIHSGCTISYHLDEDTMFIIIDFKDEWWFDYEESAQESHSYYASLLK